MALGNIIRSAAAAAFEVTEDLLQTFTFQSKDPSSEEATEYDFMTGTRTIPVSEIELKGIRLSTPSTAIEGGVAIQGDISLLVQSSSNSDLVMVDTEVTDTDGNKWFVVLINKDPADATVEFLLRTRN